MLFSWGKPNYIMSVKVQEWAHREEQPSNAFPWSNKGRFNVHFDARTFCVTLEPMMIFCVHYSSGFLKQSSWGIFSHIYCIYTFWEKLEWLAEQMTTNQKFNLLIQFHLNKQSHWFKQSHRKNSSIWTLST